MTAPGRAHRGATSCSGPVEASLTRLRTDYIDLYQQHHYDPRRRSRRRCARSTISLAGQGPLHRQFEFPGPGGIAEAEYVARHDLNRFVSCQDEYSLVARDIEKDLLPAATEYNLGLLPFFPLASGLLTGKYLRGARPRIRVLQKPGP